MIGSTTIRVPSSYVYISIGSGSEISSPSRMRQKERASERLIALNSSLFVRLSLLFVVKRSKSLTRKDDRPASVFEHARRFKFLPSIDLNAIKCVFLFEEHVLNVQELCETSACAICKMLCWAKRDKGLTKRKLALLRAGFFGDETSDTACLLAIKILFFDQKRRVLKHGRQKKVWFLKSRFYQPQST